MKKCYTVWGGGGLEFMMHCFGFQIVNSTSHIPMCEVAQREEETRKTLRDVVILI